LARTRTELSPAVAYGNDSKSAARGRVGLSRFPTLPNPLPSPLPRHGSSHLVGPV